MNGHPPAYDAQAPQTQADNASPPYTDGAISDDLQSMDDERRMVPSGWIRAFDRVSRNPFYVETRSGRATWAHPYDDDGFLSTLSKDHPGHPESPAGLEAAGKSRRELEEEEKRANMTGAKRWFAKRADEFLHGEAAQREAAAKKRGLAALMADYERRRNMLISGNTNDPSIRHLYADHPFNYTPPKAPRTWGNGSTLSRYAYGYNERWAKRYEPELGPEAHYGGPNLGVMGSLVASEGVNYTHSSRSNNYGFSG